MEKTSIPGKSMRKRKIVNDIKVYVINLTLLAFSWGGFSRCRLANSDTLWGEIDPGATLISRLSNFRWLGYVGDAFSYRILHFYPFEHRTLSILLFVMVLAAALLMMQLTFTRVLNVQNWSLKQKTIFLAATSLCFINVLTSELFYFTESFLIFKASIALAMLGCLLYSRKHYVIGSVLLFLAPMFYQMSCIYAALVLCTLAYLESINENWGQIARKEFGYLCFAMSGGVLNYLTGPWIDSKISQKVGYDILPSKQIQSDSLLWLVQNILRQLKELYESSLGLMIPLWLPLFFSLVLTGMVVRGIFLVGRKADLRIYILYKVVSFFLMCGMAAISFQGEFVCRVTAPFYTMQAMNTLTALYWLERAKERKVRCDVRKVAGIVITGYLALQYFFIQAVVSNRMVSENLDIWYANQILNIVEKYEEKTGTKVEAAAFCVDSDYSAYYDQVHYYHSAINSRVAGQGTYSLVETVASWRDIDLERGEMDEAVYEEFFEGKNWDAFDSEEQVVIQNGNLYVCVY